MTIAEMIAEKLMEKVIPLGMLRQTMDAEDWDMRTTVNMWKAKLARHVAAHVEDVEHWLKQFDTSGWADEDADDPAAEALRATKMGGYIEGYIDGFADAVRIKPEPSHRKKGRK